jgi:hypothetical protein
MVRKQFASGRDGAAGSRAGIATRPDRPRIAPARGPATGWRKAAAAASCGIALIGSAGQLAAAGSQASDARSDPPSCSKDYREAFILQPGPSDIGKSGQRALSGLSVLHGWGLAENLAVVSGDDRFPAVIQVRYPKGSFDPGAKSAPRGGAGFQTPVLASAHVDAACLRYAVKFPSGFDFVKGGKLPGLYGGVAPSGCRSYGDDDGFSLRYMWRSKGAGELYAYLPGRSERCGESVGRGTWSFPPGRWVLLEQEVVLNQPGRADGTVEVWVDGKRVLSRTDVTFRQSAQIAIAGLMFSTFFGGSDPSWASPSDQSVQFADFRIFTRTSR